MPSNKKLLMLPGDGIGPEVCREIRKIVDWMDKRRAVSFDIDEDLVGGAAYDAHGTPLTDNAMDKAQNSDAVIFGAVGGPQYDSLGWDARPEAGLLRLRKDMDLFANLRPAVTFDALLGASSLKPEIIQGLDIMIVRELTSGVYFGEPRGPQDWHGQPRVVDTQAYTQSEIERVAEVAFDLARKRNGKVHSAEKANVMKTGVFWRETVTEVHQRSFQDVALHHILADNCAMQLVRWPKQFDVLVTDNLFGDMLSDVAAMLTGSLGMLPSASLGGIDHTGRRKALYEPVHGSAPDIAGQGKANPLAMLLSFAMALRYSFDLGDDADLIENAAQAVLSTGKRTLDIMSEGCDAISTGQMGDAIVAELDKQAA